MEEAKRVNLLIIRIIVIIVYITFLLGLYACSLVQNGPTARISLNVAQGTAPLKVTLDGSASFSPNGKIISYVWSLGDGTEAQTVSLTHTYRTPGRYIVQLSITDNKGKSDSITVAINVLTPSVRPPNIQTGDLVFVWDPDCAASRIAKVIRVENNLIKIRLMRTGHEVHDIAYSCSSDAVTRLDNEQIENIRKIPEEYYKQNQQYLANATLERLEKFLTEIKMPNEILGTRYELTRFVAYTEVQLENEGFDARIVIGPSPWPRTTGEHSWIIVYLDNANLAIELSDPAFKTEALPGLIHASDYFLCPYYNSPKNRIYYGIYEVIAAEGVEKFSWWKGLPGQQ